MPILEKKLGHKYIEYIKTFKCSACFQGPTDPDHLLSVGMGGNRKNDMWEHFSCVPLCRSCHTERHDLGTYQFEHKHNVNLWRDAHRYLMDFLTK